MADKKIWAPWRAAFILGKKEKGCILCNRFRQKDTIKNLILYRGETAFVILNKFPYNSGHCMIVPNKHVSDLQRLTKEQAAEFFELTRTTVAVIKKAVQPHSMNIGMNLGRISGAGIPGHLHMHVVPRWTGDTNFMPVIGKTDIVSIPLEWAYRAIKAEFDKL
ncbi:MAG: HIT domain-containing protein [Candidatus Zixiibacteriota bacterium]|nr:MAG: HIT domain-containing protein [candidate division Zixibacteria bacterium]